jgi:Protein of unknown function (DUF1264)
MTTTIKTAKKNSAIIAGGFAIAFALATVFMLSSLGPSAIAQQQQQQQERQQQGMNATMNATTNTTGTAANVTKPVDGYNLPIGHLNAVRHIFDDPSLRVEHFCKPHDRIMMVCQLYDSNSANATLIGIEYIITQEQYDSLPNREKPYWHAHREEFSPTRADPRMPELSPDQARAEMAKMLSTWGKVIITWVPNDDMPSFPPQVQLVDHPFMVNATVGNNDTSTGQ